MHGLVVHDTPSVSPSQSPMSGGEQQGDHLQEGLATRNTAQGQGTRGKLLPNEAVFDEGLLVSCA